MRRSRPSNAIRSGTWRQLRPAILARDNYQCQIRAPGCTRHATQVDHIIARCDGGPPFDEANLRAACAACNCRRGGQLARYHDPRRARPRLRATPSCAEPNRW